MEEYKMRIAIKKIRKSLIEQLEAKGANIPLFQDQIETYIFFVEREREMAVIHGYISIWQGIC